MFKKFTFLDYVPEKKYKIIGNCVIRNLLNILDLDGWDDWYSCYDDKRPTLTFYIDDKKYTFDFAKENNESIEKGFKLCEAFINFIKSINYDYIISVKHVEKNLWTGVVIKFIE